MARLLNKSGRALELPRRRRGAQVFRCMLEDGAQKSVPDWYVEELLDEPGPALRLSRGELELLEGGDENAPTEVLEDLKGVSVAEAAPLIAEAGREELVAWARADKRKGVLSRIEARLEALAAEEGSTDTGASDGDTGTSDQESATD